MHTYPLQSTPKSKPVESQLLGAHQLIPFLRVTLVIETTLVILVWFLSPMRPYALAAASAALAITLAAAGLAYFGRLYLAGLVFHFGEGLVLLVAAYYFPQVQQLMFAVFIVLIFNAWVVTGQRSAYWMVGVSLVGVLGIISLQSLIPSPFTQFAIHPIMVYTGITCSLIWSLAVLRNMFLIVQAAVKNAEVAITQRFKYDTALQELEGFYQEIVHSMDEGLAVQDAQGMFYFVNPAACRMSGYSQEELLNSHWTILVPEDQRHIIEAADQRRLQGTADSYEVEIRRKDGQRLAVHLGGRPRFHPKTGEFLGTLAVFTDITSLKHALSATRESEERLLSYFDQANDLIFRLDRQYRLVFVNRTLCQALGYTAEEMLGRKVTDFLSPQIQEFVNEQIPTLKNIDTIPEIVLPAQTKTGADLWVELRGRNLLTDGAETGTLFIARDITARRRAESEAARLTALVEQAAVNVAIIDEHGNFLYVNQNFCESVGYARAELVEQQAEILRNPQQPPEYYTELLKSISAGQTWRGNLEQFRKDGTLMYWDLLLFPIDVPGMPRIYAAVGQDITEQVIAQSELREYANRLEVLRSLDETILAAQFPEEIARVALFHLHSLIPYDQGLVISIPADFHMAHTLAHTSPLGGPPPASTFPVNDLGTLGSLTAAAHRLVPDLGTQASLSPWEKRLLETWDIKSLVYLTLAARDVLIGIVILGSQQPNAFNQKHIQIATQVGAPLALALQQAQLRQAERQLRQEAQALVNLTGALTETLELERLLDQLLTNLGRVVPFDSSSVMLLSGSQLQFAARQGSYPPVQNFFKLSQESLTHMRDVLLNRQVVILPDVTSNPAWVALKGGEYIRSWMGVPLVFKDRTIGLLNLNNSQVNFYTPNHAKLALAFAHQASAAIENARLYEVERRRRAELETLQRASLHLTASLDRSQVLEALLEHVLHLTAADNAHIFLYENQRLAFGAAMYAGSRQKRPVAEPRPEGLTYSVAHSGQRIIIPDISQDPRFAAFDNAGTLIGLPLQTRQQVRGVMNIAYLTPHTIDEHELRVLELLADQAAIAIENAQLFAETQRRLQRLDALRTIDQAITASVDLRLTLDILLEQTTNQLNIDAATVLLLGAQSQVLELAARRGFRTGLLRPVRLRLGESHAGRAAFERRIIHISDLSASAADNKLAATLAQEGFQTYFAIPLIAKGMVKGVLELFNRTQLEPDPEWYEFLESMADQAAIALDNATMFENLQRANIDLMLAYDNTLEGWSRALDLRDSDTVGHTQRVTELTIKLARLMGISDRELVQIRRGALLHDIGKMGIPDNILLKPGPLTPEEWVIMKKHPEYALQFLSPIEFLRPALDIPYCHHEKWNGSGYPRGLKGEQIPLSARVFAVIDVWDALSSDRPYRARWNSTKVRQYIQERSGIEFDPQVVANFFQLLDLERD